MEPYSSFLRRQESRRSPSSLQEPALSLPKGSLDSSPVSGYGAGSSRERRCSVHPAFHPTWPGWKSPCRFRPDSNSSYSCYHTPTRAGTDSGGVITSPYAPAPGMHRLVRIRCCVQFPLARQFPGRPQRVGWSRQTACWSKDVGRSPQLSWREFVSCPLNSLSVQYRGPNGRSPKTA